MKTPRIDDVVRGYIQLRDQKAKLKAKYENEVEGLNTKMAVLEGFMLQEVEATGVDSFKTADGTAYRYSQNSATVADWDTLLHFIQSNEMWNLLERRVSKLVVEEYRQEHQQLPPGVKFSSIYKIGFQRS